VARTTCTSGPFDVWKLVSRRVSPPSDCVPAEFRKTLRSEIYFSEPIVAVLPRDHALEDTEAIQLAQLSAERIILYARQDAPELFDAIIAMCRRAKFSPNIVDTRCLWQSVLTMVEAAEGIALVPACVQHLRSNGVSFRTLRDKRCQVDVVLAWRQSDPDAICDGFLACCERAGQTASGLSRNLSVLAQRYDAPAETELDSAGYVWPSQVAGLSRTSIPLLPSLSPSASTSDCLSKTPADTQSSPAP
jgi:hypothetical protein